ncbi:uncharacterized protein LOC127137411 [Lathyrus oleraceus]|uniref:uncharacterized protein LOC127137411 n=1 Tax=Pisum sativum TaxID=3888 RepID=UPI0021D07A89|nr:uncharacterized protein LOC127137411 [Pisum sativum]
MDATEHMQMFVNGLKIKTKQLIDTAAGGSTNFSTATDIKKIIEAIAASEHMELYDRCQSKPEGVIDLKLETAKTRIEDTIAAEVKKKLKAMNIGTRQVAQIQPTPTIFVKSNHPDISWKDQKATAPQHGQYQTQYQQHQQQQMPKKAGWEISIERMVAHHVQFQEETQNYQKNTIASIKNLEVQMRQIAQQITSSSQAQGVLPSATVPNPREHHNVSTVTTRSVVREEVVAPKPIVKETVIEPKPAVKLPFPTRNKKKGQHEKNFKKFLEFFKKLEINIPLLEALEQMPTYAKFMKDIISNKRTTNTNPIILTETYSAILQGMKIPIKKEDRGAVTITCTIGDRSFNKALIDMGASVSLMTLSIYKKLGIGAVQDTRITLQFEDHSVKKPYGIVKDVLVKIDKFVFSVDFVILEMSENEEIPLILGRPLFGDGKMCNQHRRRNHDVEGL